MGEGGSTKPGSAGRLKAPELPGKCSFRYHYRDVPAPLPPSVRFFFSFLFFPRVRDWCVGYSRKSRLPDPAPTSAPQHGCRIFPLIQAPGQSGSPSERNGISRRSAPVFKIMSLFLLPSQNLFRQTDIKSTRKY